MREEWTEKKHGYLMPESRYDAAQPAERQIFQEGAVEALKKVLAKGQSFYDLADEQYVVVPCADIESAIEAAQQNQ